MPSTRWEDSSFAVGSIADRTDSSGTSIDDLTAEDNRLINSLLKQGWLIDPDSFVVTPVGGNMQIKVGSGSGKVDRYVVAGTAAGQGAYLVRHEASTKTITIDAAPGSSVRYDEIWLVVEDNVYELGGRSLPRLAYRKGDPGAGFPGPEASWRARALLARVTVPTGKTSIVAGDIQENRTQSTFEQSLLGPLIDDLGDVEGQVGGIADRVAALEDSTMRHLLTRTPNGDAIVNFTGINSKFRHLHLRGRYRMGTAGDWAVGMRLDNTFGTAYDTVCTRVLANNTQQTFNSMGTSSARVAQAGGSIGVLTLDVVDFRGTLIGWTSQFYGRHGGSATQRYTGHASGYFNEGPINNLRLVSDAPGGFIGRFDLYAMK